MTCGPRRSPRPPGCVHGSMPPAERWEEFRRRYTGELRSSPAVCDFVRRIAGKDTVTLLYASKNAAGNHALILQEYLARATAAAGVTNVRYS